MGRKIEREREEKRTCKREREGGEWRYEWELAIIKWNKTKDY